MFVDASALTAILANEPEALALLEKLEAAEMRATSPLAVWEAGVALSRILRIPVATIAFTLRAFLKKAEIEVRPLPPESGYQALEAFDRYGKGRHPAKLNFGDCFAYACAKHANLPLLYKGDDFSLTDAVPA